MLCRTGLFTALRVLTPETIKVWTCNFSKSTFLHTKQANELAQAMYYLAVGTLTVNFRCLPQASGEGSHHMGFNNIKEISTHTGLVSRYNMSYFNINKHKHKLSLYVYI